MHSITTNVSPRTEEYSGAEEDTTSFDMTMPRKRHRRREHPESVERGTIVSKEFIVTVKETRKREKHLDKSDEFLKSDGLMVSFTQKTKEEKSTVRKYFHIFHTQNYRPIVGNLTIT